MLRQTITPGFTRNSAPLWARGQDAFLVIRGSRVQAQLATQECYVKALETFTFVKRGRLVGAPTLGTVGPTCCSKR